MGCLLLEGSVEATLDLEDFVTNEAVTITTKPCAMSNFWIVAVLKNIQTTMQIVFSEVFETCLDNFIDNLEGSFRPMD